MLVLLRSRAQLSADAAGRRHRRRARRRRAERRDRLPDRARARRGRRRSRSPRASPTRSPTSILLAVGVGALAGTGWRLDRTWALLAAGILAFWFADSMYLVKTAEGTYESGGWFDAGWWAGLLLIAVAAWQRPPARRRRAADDSLRLIVAPLVVRRDRRSSCSSTARWATSTRSPSRSPPPRWSFVMIRLTLTFRQNVGMLRASRDEALTDALTGLGNRRALTRDARRRARRGRARVAARARALRPRRLQALQRHLRPPRRRRPARPPRRQPGRASSAAAAAPSGWAATSSARSSSRAARTATTLRRRRRARSLASRATASGSAAPTASIPLPDRGDRRRRGAADRRPAHVRAEERRPRCPPPARPRTSLLGVLGARDPDARRTLAPSPTSPTQPRASSGWTPRSARPSASPPSCTRSAA